MRHHSSLYRVNQVLAVIVLFLLIILPLCLILFKGFVSSEDGTFGEHIQQLGQPYHLKILWNSVILGSRHIMHNHCTTTELYYDKDITF